MKKINLIAFGFACLALLAAFASGKQEKKKESNTGYFWWDFIGSTLLDQYTQTEYVLDDDQIPDCSVVTTTINCEIYALKDVNNTDYPDMTSIIARRYPPQ